jgi:hypothetical protein
MSNIYFGAIWYHVYDNKLVLKFALERGHGHGRWAGNEFLNLDQNNGFFFVTIFITFPLFVFWSKRAACRRTIHSLFASVGRE